MSELSLFLIGLTAILPISFLDVTRVTPLFSYFNGPIVFFFLDMLKSFVYFFGLVLLGCPLKFAPVLAAILISSHERVLLKRFMYRFYSVFAVAFGFLLFFVPGLVLLMALTFGLSFLILRSGRWSLIGATITMPCLGYVLYSYIFFKFLMLLCGMVLGLHYWQVRKIQKSVSIG